MWDKATGATLDWSEPDMATRTKAPPSFGFRCLEDMLVMPATAASDVELGLENITKCLRDLGTNWNPLTNTGGTLPILAVNVVNLHVNYVCIRNIGNRPWLDELCRIQPTIIELFDDLFTTAPTLKPKTTEIEKLPAAPLRQQEIEWLSSNARKLGRYEGKWIALEGTEIVAWGSDEVEVEMRAREKGIKVPLLVRIPPKNDIPFVGSNLDDSNNIR